MPGTDSAVQTFAVSLLCLTPVQACWMFAAQHAVITILVTDSGFQLEEPHTLPLLVLWPSGFHPSFGNRSPFLMPGPSENHFQLPDDLGPSNHAESQCSRWEWWAKETLRSPGRTEHRPGTAPSVLGVCPPLRSQMWEMCRRSWGPGAVTNVSGSSRFWSSRPTQWPFRYSNKWIYFLFKSVWIWPYFTYYTELLICQHPPM